MVLVWKTKKHGIKILWYGMKCVLGTSIRFAWLQVINFHSIIESDCCECLAQCNHQHIIQRVSGRWKVAKEAPANINDDIHIKFRFFFFFSFFFVFLQQKVHSSMCLSFKIVKCVDNEKCSFLFLSLYSSASSLLDAILALLFFIFLPSTVCRRARLIGSSALSTIPFSLSIYFINFLQDSIWIKWPETIKWFAA